MNKFRSAFFGALLALAATFTQFAIPESAQAGTITHTVSQPATLTDWDASLAVPKWEPAVPGEVLTNVTVTVEYDSHFTTFGESLNTSPRSRGVGVVSVSGAASTAFPGALVSHNGAASGYFLLNTQYDGVTDYAGTSGSTEYEDQVQSYSRTIDPADFAAYTGPGSLSVASTGRSTFTANSIGFSGTVSSSLGGSVSLGATLTVTYTWSDAPEPCPSPFAKTKAKGKGRGRDRD